MSPNDLQRAYELIRDGRMEDAREILVPLCKAQPDHIKAWWLLSFALDESEHIRDTLERVLQLDPTHTKARQRLAALSQRQPASNNVLPRLVLVGILGLIVAAVIVVFFLKGEDQAIINSIEDAEAALTQVAAARGDTSTPLPRATLPPTWTPSPTFTPSASPTITLTSTPHPLATSTMPFDPNTLPTLEPLLSHTPSATPSNTPQPSPTEAATNTPAPSPTRVVISQEFLASTYWEGDGIFSMEDAQIDGAYLRHFHVPVTVWIDPNVGQDWLLVIDHAIATLNTVVPMQRVSSVDDANIPIYFEASASVYESHCPPESTGCAYVGIATDEFEEYFIVESWVRIRGGTEPSSQLIAHELIHALGVVVHSPNQNDLMYREYIFASSLDLSARDRLVLEMLYLQPAIGAEFAEPQ